MQEIRMKPGHVVRLIAALTAERVITVTADRTGTAEADRSDVSRGGDASPAKDRSPGFTSRSRSFQKLTYGL